MDVIPPTAPPHYVSVLAEGTGRGPWADALGRLAHDRAASFAAGLLLVLFATLAVGPLLLGLDAEAQDLAVGAQSPSWQHLFGTDLLGRDLFARVLAGGQLTVFVSVFATWISASVGIAYGAAAGWLGGRLDGFMMRIVDAIHAVPVIFAAGVLMVLVRAGRTAAAPGTWLEATLDPTWGLFVALAALQWMTMARIVRGQIRSLRERAFVDAARLAGASGFAIVRRHLLPNSIGTIVVYGTLMVPGVILQEAFLSFLGLGVEAPRASWGTLVQEGVRVMAVHPWMLIFPALFLAVTIVSWNALGDGLRDALEARTRRS